MGAATAVREHGAMFKGPLVKAILDGRKTQTRRLAKPRCVIPDGRYEMRRDPVYGKWVLGPADASLVSFMQAAHGWVNRDFGRRPFGVPGENLWVKETYGEGWDGGAGFYTAIPPTGREQEPEKYFYKADGWDESKGRRCWKPSMSMPRRASRITLDVTAVIGERLQDITEQNAIAEGTYEGRIPADEEGPERVGYMVGPDDGMSRLYPTARLAFAAFWDSLAPEGSRWADNPWVWVYEFRRLSPSPAS